MNTLFETKPTKKAKITLDELLKETSKVLPKREELQVMDYSMMSTPYYASNGYYGGGGGGPYGYQDPTLSGNYMGNGGYMGHTYPNTSFTQVTQFPQYGGYGGGYGGGFPHPPVAQPQFDWAHATTYQSYNFGNYPNVHTSPVGYDPNCFYPSRIDYHPGNENWDHINKTDGHWNHGNGHWNRQVDIKPWHPTDWNNFQYKAYPVNGTAYIYPNPNFKAV